MRPDLKNQQTTDLIGLIRIWTWCGTGLVSEGDGLPPPGLLLATAGIPAQKVNTVVGDG